MSWVFVAGLAALEVGVFNPQQEFAGRCAREKPVIRSGAHNLIPQAGRGRSKSYTGNGVHHGNKHDSG